MNEKIVEINIRDNILKIIDGAEVKAQGIVRDKDGNIKTDKPK
jgi:hypothetical protein